MFSPRVLTISLWLIIGTLIAYSVALAAQVVTLPTIAVEMNTDVQVVEAAQTDEQYAQRLGLATANSAESDVRTYFRDIPVMVRIAYCESHFEHTQPTTGVVTRGRVNPADVGVMQINEYYHKQTAESMGLDLHDLEDNMAYGRYLYEREGTRPWNASRSCWQSTTLAMR